jgi:outer membrane autotransporter protein
LVLAQANTYTGGTTISNGTLQLGEGGTSGSIMGDVANNGTLTFDRSDTSAFSGVASGTGNVTQIGSGTTVFTEANTYTGGTTISAGTLQLGDGNTSGSIVGDVIDNSTLSFNRSDTSTFPGVVSGTGDVTQIGSGTTVLTGANTYSGTTTISAGTLQVGNGSNVGSLGTGAVVDNAALVFDRSDTVSYGGVVSGTGSFTQAGSGTLVLTGNSTYTGPTAVNAGVLLVNGSLGNSAVSVASGATLGGAGIIGGSVTVNGGTVAPGAQLGQAGTLTLAGLTLHSQLDFDLAMPNVIGTPNDLINDTGDLSLSGVLNVNDTGQFATTPGSYRLINYNGALSGSGLTLGSIPGGADEAVVQTAVPNQVNLIKYLNGLPVQFWDGVPANASNNVIDGGNGTWDNTTGNWTNVTGNINQSWIPGMAIFTATPGTVTLGAPISASALQFLSDGYRVEGNGNTLTLISLPAGATPLIRVDPGVTATIDATLAGSSGLEKADPGTLVLAQANTYTGGTTISNGTLQLGEGGTSGSIMGDVANNGTLIFDRSDTSTFAGAISGAGAVDQIGSGTTVLANASTYTGPTMVSVGTLELDGSLTSDITVQNGAVLSGIGSTTGGLINLGTVAPDSPATTGSLLIGGDYAGQGGSLVIKAVLNAGGPGNQVTDRLLVEGDASGVTPLEVQALPGSTPMLTGNSNVSGISVVQVGGAASATAFELPNGFVASGPYELRLYQFPAGASAPTETDSRLAGVGITSMTDYRLQVPVVQPVTPTTPSPPGGAPLPPATQPGPPITSKVTTGGFTASNLYVPAGLPVGMGPNGEAVGDPVVLPQVPVYRALAPAALSYGFMLVDDLHKRLGDIEQTATSTDNVETFARYSSWSGSLVNDQLTTVGQDMWFMQAGVGWIGRSLMSSDDQLHLDVVGSLGNSYLKDDINDARLSFRGQSVGATATYMAARGWYVDAVLQDTDYQDVRTVTAQQGVVGNFGGHGWLGSIESGYPFAFAGTVIEPRASVGYQDVSFDHSVDTDQVSFQLRGDDSFLGRLGVRAEHPFVLSNEGPNTIISPYLTLDYVHDFHGGKQEDLSTVDFSTASAGSALHYGGGATAQLGLAWNIYLTFDRSLARGGQGSTGNEGMAGVRFTF